MNVAVNINNKNGKQINVADFITNEATSKYDEVEECWLVHEVEGFALR